MDLRFKLVPVLLSSLSRESLSRRPISSRVQQNFPALSWITRAVFTLCAASWFCVVGFPPELFETTLKYSSNCAKRIRT